MKFKVGDRVKTLKGKELGTVDYIQDNEYPYVVKWDKGMSSGYMDNELELIQTEAQEPIPGKFYRTRGGLKLLYVGMGNLDRFVYQEEDGYFNNYVLPFNYFDDRSESALDIVGEWVDSPESQIEEVTLPAMEIKRWAVVFTKDGKFIRRGDVVCICSSFVDAVHRAAECEEHVEIVELIGTLPERKVT